MKAILASILTLSAIGTIHAQVDHFPQQRWKEMKTPHYTIRTQGASSSIAKKYVEKIWAVNDRCMAEISKEYQDNTFVTINGAKGSDDKPYRHTVYLVGRKYPFEEMVDASVKNMGKRAEGQKQICMQTKLLPDGANRYSAFCLDDRKNEFDAQLVHSIASSQLAGHGRMGEGNFFHTAGYGYYVEHIIFKKCRVHYLDFDLYYEGQDAEIVRGGTLDGSSSWTRPIQKMVKKGAITPRLGELVGLQVSTLNPNRSGMLFALAHFMCHTPENAKKHSAYLAKLREGKKPSAELIVECFGFDGEGAFNVAFKNYILSRQFR